MSLFDQKAVAAAVRAGGFQRGAGSKSRCDFFAVFQHYDGRAQIERAHKAGKLLIHMDFAEGIGKDRAGLHFIKLKGADGILTTKTNMIRPAKDIGLSDGATVFIVDSPCSVDTAVESIRIAKRMWWEIMPGVVCKKIRRFARKRYATHRSWQVDSSKFKRM